MCLFEKVTKVLLEFGADSFAKDCNGAFPDGVIGAGCPGIVDPACARELNDVVVGHRWRIKGGEFHSIGVSSRTFQCSDQRTVQTRTAGFTRQSSYYIRSIYIFIYTSAARQE